MIIGLSPQEQATIPGTVAPHDSGFISIALPSSADDLPGYRVYANVITAAGNVRSPAFAERELPPFPVPMRFSRLFPNRSDATRSP
jgi:hypothetical protein